MIWGHTGLREALKFQKLVARGVWSQMGHMGEHDYREGSVVVGARGTSIVGRPQSGAGGVPYNLVAQSTRLPVHILKISPKQMSFMSQKA